MADVKLKFFADEAAATRAIVALEKKYIDLENKIKGVGRASKKSSEEGALTMRSLMAAAGPAVTGLLSVQTAIQGVSAAYRIWKKDIADAAAEHQKFTRQLMTELALTSDLAAGPQIKKALQSVPAVLEGQAAAAFGGVRGAAPTMPLQKVLALTQAVSALAPVLAPLDAAGKLTDSSKLQAMGDVAGTLAQLMPQTSAGDIADLSMAVSASAGDRVAQLRSAGFEKAIGAMTQAGVPPERALAMAVNALDVGADPAALALASGKLNADKGVTMDALLADPAMASKVLGNRAAVGFNLLDNAAISELEKGFVGAQKTNLVEQKLREAAKMSPEAFALQGIFSTDEKADRPFGEFKSARDVRRQAAFEEAPGWAKPIVSAGQGIQSMFESSKLGVQGEQAFETGGYQRPEKSLEQIMPRVEAALEELVRLTAEQNGMVANRQPGVNRQANVE